MKIIKTFESYTSINESKKSKKDKGYEVGDIVRIEYWYIDEEDCPNELYKKMPHTPVKIIEAYDENKLDEKGKPKIPKFSFKVSHNIEQSKIKGAPDEIIKRSDIIDKFR
jgi:hypothetical protein